MRLAQRRRDDRLRDRAPDHVGGAVAEQALRRAVDAQHDAAVVHRHDRVERDVEHRPPARRRLAQRPRHRDLRGDALGRGRERVVRRPGLDAQHADARGSAESVPPSHPSSACLAALSVPGSAANAGSGEAKRARDAPEQLGGGQVPEAPGSLRAASSPRPAGLSDARNRPPSASTRSASPRSPEPPSGRRAADAVVARPRSTRAPFERATPTDTTDAHAYLATLVSASATT